MDSDCHHEINRCLLLGRKAMTNLDSILKSRNITLLTKVPLVKALVSCYCCLFCLVKRGMLLSLRFSRPAPLQGLKSLKIFPVFYMSILKDIYFKRCLLLGRKAMTNIDSILKSRDVTFPTKVQFSSVAQLYSTLCDPMDGSTPGLPVHHQLPEFTQTHVH